MNNNELNIRKIYKINKSGSVVFNIPLDIARRKEFKPGDSINVIEVKDGILLKKISKKDFNGI